MLRTIRWLCGGCLIVAFLVSAAADHGAAPGTVGSSCEPADFVNISARTLSVIDQGATARVTVELKVLPEPAQPARIRVAGTIRGEAGERPMAGRVASLTRGRPNKLRYTFDLETGAVHHLLFEARAESHPNQASTAYLRVNLDPELEPEVHGDVLQYRARMVEGVSQ